MRDFRRLEVWRRSRGLTADVYRLTATFPPEERYGITAQMRRAVISIPSNLAEGAGRSTDRDFARFIDLAQGSAFELESQLTLCVDLGLAIESSTGEILDEVRQLQRMLHGLAESLRQSPGD
jgi:four helix bundle protein